MVIAMVGVVGVTRLGSENSVWALLGLVVRPRAGGGELRGIVVGTRDGEGGYEA